MNNLGYVQILQNNFFKILFVMDEVCFNVCLYTMSTVFVETRKVC